MSSEKTSDNHTFINDLDAGEVQRSMSQTESVKSAQRLCAFPDDLQPEIERPFELSLFMCLEKKLQIYACVQVLAHKKEIVAVIPISFLEG